MSPAFIQAAKRMLRYRTLLLGALAGAIISATGLGAGLLAIAPVLDALVGQGQTLPEMAADFNARSPIDIPQSVIQTLPTKQFTAVIVVVSLLCLLTLLGAVANFTHLFLSLSIVERTVAHVRRDLFRAVINLPLRAVVAGGSSDPVSRVVNDPQQLGAGLSALLGKGVAQVSKGIASFAVALIVEWRLTLFTLILAPLLYTVIRRLGKKIRRASRAALERQADLYAAATEAVQGLRVVKTHNAERYESGRFHRINKRALGELLRVRLARATSSPVVETLAIFVLAGLALIAVKAVDDGEMTATQMILAIGALGLSGASLRPLTGIVNDIQQSSAAAERINKILAAPPEPGRDRTLPALPRHTTSIELDTVSFTYPTADRLALDAVSLTINAGETVAFVGPNGSGKTTLLSLVPRLFEPDAGRVLIDGTDITTVSVRSLRKQIGVVTQETVLFKGTIADNIAYGAEAATRARVVEAARQARADAFIEEKGGYDLVVGERGLTLSGGQRQRIAIARAILRDPAILLLDEATSMIDAESEAKINTALDEFASGRTCLVVAHRLSTVLAADRIVVLDEGRLIDQGTHDQLMQRCDTYKRIAERQLVPASD